MRFYEIVTEGSLKYEDKLKHYGKYALMVINAIKDGNPWPIDPKDRDKLGIDEIYIKPESAQAFQDALFGKNVNPEKADELNVDDKGFLIPADSNTIYKVKQPNGKEKGINFDFEVDQEQSGINMATISWSKLEKTANMSTKAGYNKGDITEAILGAAVGARFVKRNNGDVNPRDVYNVIKSFDTEPVKGKSTLRGLYVAQAGEDTIQIEVVLTGKGFKTLIDQVTSGSPDPTIVNLVASSVKYVNEDSGVEAANQRIIEDTGKNKVLVKSDGTGDQTGTKADLFLYVDDMDHAINLLSLKAGNVGQFGQGSGYKFSTYQELFRTTFGIEIDEKFRGLMQKGEDEKDKHQNYPIVFEIFKDVGKKIARELAGDNTQQEIAFIKRVLKGIQTHATRNDDKVEMVIVGDGPKASYKKLRFGENLQLALNDYDLEVDVITDQGAPLIEVFGKKIGTSLEKSFERLNKNRKVVRMGFDKEMMLFQLRTNNKQGENTIRNIIEMGPLLKLLATVDDAIPQQPIPQQPPPPPPEGVN